MEAQTSRYYLEQARFRLFANSILAVTSQSAIVSLAFWGVYQLIYCLQYKALKKSIRKKLIYDLYEPI